VKNETIEIVDRGRGLQLSTSRVTVQDLVPYFHEGCSHEEIMRWIPSLSCEEIAVVEHYYHAHKVDLDEQDNQIRAHVAEQIRLQRLRFPEGTSAVRRARMEETLRRHQKERNGQGNPGR